MHRLSCFLVAAMILGFTADVAPAQIGQGRILKKIRDDLFGSPEERAREEAARKAAIQKKKQEAARQAQLEAQRRAQTGRQPTPVRTQQQPRANSQAPNPLAAPEIPRGRSANNAPAKRGFGFTVRDQGDEIIITSVDPLGNAAEAGLRRGDAIVGIGGVEVDSQKAFDEIAEILNPGDTIEVSYRRGKQTNDVQIGYGQAPEVDEHPETAGLLAPGDDAGTFRGSQSVLNQDSTARQIEHLNRTVIEQQRVIEQLQNQIRQMQQTGAPGAFAPPNRSSNSVLQDPSSSRRINR